MVHKMHGNLLIVDKDRRHFLSFVLYSELSKVANYPSSFLLSVFIKHPVIISLWETTVNDSVSELSKWIKLGD